MECLSLRSGRGITIRTHRVGDRVKLPSQNHVRLTPSKVGPTSMVVNAAAAEAAMEVVQGGGTHMRGGAEKLDHWIKESVGEIVKNLREAPLFVHVYNEPGTRLKTERAVAEDWKQLKGKWVNGEEPSPEGIILVEELKEDEEDEEGQFGDSTKAWGVLIQGKGEDGGVACYLLKTSKVGCANLGLFCTHYCLVKVNNFRQTARSQLTSCWLV